MMNSSSMYLLGVIVGIPLGLFYMGSRNFLGAAYYYIKTYRHNNRTHRSGVKMKDMSTSYLVSKAREELDEFEDSYVNGDQAELNELCDVLNILFHIAIKHGWTPKELGEMMIVKMNMRFLD